MHAIRSGSAKPRWRSRLRNTSWQEPRSIGLPWRCSARSSMPSRESLDWSATRRGRVEMLFDQPEDVEEGKAEQGEAKMVHARIDRPAGEDRPEKTEQ